MLKRTKGRLLLAMLVITGLAGTTNDTSLSTKERKVAVNQLKDTRNNLLITIKGLSEAQLNFRTEPGNPSVKECFYHLVVTEQNLWAQLDKLMKEHTRPEQRSVLPLKDDLAVAAQVNGTGNFLTPDHCSLSNVRWKSIDQAMGIFKSLRAQQLRYIKTTTGDLRNRFIKTTAGWLDGYQYVLFLSGNSRQHFRLIDDILSHKNFPPK